MAIDRSYQSPACILSTPIHFQGVVCQYDGGDGTILLIEGNAKKSFFMKDLRMFF